jgi:hypothetical protein
VVLAPAERSDPAVSRQRSEGCAVLHRAQISREVVAVGDLATVLLVGAERVQVGDGEEGGHDQRARAADPGRRRKVARERDVRAAKRAGEVARDATRDRDHIVRPAALGRQDRRAELDLDVLAARGVGHPDQPVITRRGDDREPALDGTDEAPAARVVRMLAEKLDPPRNPEPQRLALAECRRDFREQAVLPLDLVLRHARQREPFVERVPRHIAHHRASQHRV